MAALNVQEAYDALEQYGATYGRIPLLVLLHAAVPQSFRADMLNLIKLNFLAHEAGTDLTVDADVLFSPLVESVAAGYYRLDPEVRRHCLALLDAAYRYEPERRSAEVARFVLAYADEMERRVQVILDPLLMEYLTIQRWVALAFIDPTRAASEFAQALERSETESDAAVRARIGTMAAALSIPLECQDRLLAYARGLDAISRGDDEVADQLFAALGNEEIRVGEVVLRPAQPRDWRAEVEGEPEAVPLRPRIFISYGRENTSEAQRMAETLGRAGAEVFSDLDNLRTGEPFERSLADAIRRSNYFVAVVSIAVLKSERRSMFREWRSASDEELHRPEGSHFMIPVIVDDTPRSELPDFMRLLKAVRAPGGNLPEDVVASLFASVRAPGTTGGRGTATPAILPEQTRAAVRLFFENENQQVLLVRGTDPTALDEIVGCVREIAESRAWEWVGIDLSYQSVWNRPEDIVREFGADALPELEQALEAGDSRQIRRLADLSLKHLQSRHACVLFRGFESVYLPWQVMDFLRELLDSATHSPSVRFVLLNFEDYLSSPPSQLAQRIELRPVSRADVVEYLRGAFEQHGQHASAAVLESAADLVFRSLNPSAGHGGLRAALERAVKLLFENA
jgi:hypothetical protein